MGLLPEFFPQVTGFEWDDGNADKNWLRHRMTRAESEQVFLNRPLLLAWGPGRTQVEIRYFALGRTDLDRHLAGVSELRLIDLPLCGISPAHRSRSRIPPTQ